MGSPIGQINEAVEILFHPGVGTAFETAGKAVKSINHTLHIAVQT
jgi:hypothetical protein